MAKRLSKSVRKQLLNILFLVLLVAVTIVVLFMSNRELNFENIGIFLKSCDPWYLVAAAAAMVLSVLFEGISLHFILRGLGERPRLHSSLVYATADVYYSAITPSASGGQPASAYYMVKDGIGTGKASFSLVFNLIGYTLAIIVIGAFAFIVRPEFYAGIDGWFARLLVILGFVLQGLLLSFFIACMFCGRAVLWCGNGIISLLTKMRIVRKPEKWRGKLEKEVEKYRACLGMLKNNPLIFIANLLCNLGQRVSAVLIACFVCMAAAPEASFLDLFAFEALVIIGYNSIPLPGGVGAFEYLYLRIFRIRFADVFILSSLMVTRMFSYYLRMMCSGVYTLVYHIRLMRRDTAKENAEMQEGDTEGGENSAPQEEEIGEEDHGEPRDELGIQGQG